jgi:hypothetical protein
MDSQTFIDLLTSLRSQNYFFVSLAVFWVYDCFLTLDQEVSLLHGTPWKKGAILYVMTRYMPVFVLCVHIYMNYLQNEDFLTCNAYIQYGIVSVVMMELPFRSKIVFQVLLHSAWPVQKVSSSFAPMHYGDTRNPFWASCCQQYSAWRFWTW